MEDIPYFSFNLFCTFFQDFSEYKRDVDELTREKIIEMNDAKKKDSDESEESDGEEEQSVKDEKVVLSFTLLLGFCSFTALFLFTINHRNVVFLSHVDLSLSI